MRVAGLLLALVLVTSCFVGGTFAKYVTSGTGVDHAKVAKWGVTVVGSSDMFAPTYAKDDDSLTVSANSVAESNNKDNLVAPGTKKDNAAVVTLSGKPEVAVRVTYDADSFALTGRWAYNDGKTGSADEYYCPLIFKITDGTTTKTIDCMGEGMKSVDDVKTAVKKAVADFSADYAPNTDLSAVGHNGLKISWEWPFEGDTAHPNQTDVKDTYLGNLATATGAESHNTIPAVYVVVTATVTQVD